jgi:hypothetical protein
MNEQDRNSLPDMDGIGSLFSHCWGRGFVAVPKGHKLYGISHKDIKATAHSGLTYSQEEEIDDSMYWVVGFDTNSAGDTIDNCDEEYVISETEMLLAQIKAI